MFKVGDIVINTDSFWASGFKANHGCKPENDYKYILGKDGSFTPLNCSNERYCCDYIEYRLDIGNRGVIIEKRDNSYLVEWLDGSGKCGKSSTSLELDIQYYREKRLEQILK